MIAVTATFKVAPENAEAFEAVIAELTAATLANEPGVSLYQLGRSQKDPTFYRLLELYADKEALDAHMNSEWFKAAGPKLGALLAERPLLEKFDTVG